MKLLSSLLISLKALKANKVRSLLTTLGIIIGVAAVISLVTITQGAKQMIENQLTALGGKSLIVNSGMKAGGGQSPYANRKIADIKPLTEKDASAISRLDTVQYVSEILDTSSNVVANGKSWFTKIVGVSPEFVYINDWPPSQGTFFNKKDVSDAALVCVIGKTVQSALFAGSSPVGQKIRIGNFTYEVIGVMNTIGQTPSGKDQDDLILMPYTAVQKRLLNRNTLGHISVAVNRPEDVQIAKAQITKVLRSTHNIKPGYEDDFHIRTQENQINTINRVLGIMTILLGSIASISLIVGGIGIMNIMLVSVSERTKEIGIRMAVGAREKDILKQFLVESIVLSLLGGLIGIVLGIIISKAASTVTGWPATVSASAVLISFFFAALVGITFGIYPARKASQLNPIEALRYE